MVAHPTRTRVALLAGLALAAAPFAAGAADAPSRPMPFPMQVEKLPSGLTVVLVPFDSPGLVAYYTLMRVGSRNEVEPGHSGFAHFFEHMMFRGTKKNPEDVYNTTVRRLGMDGNAFTSDDVTVYTFFGPSAGLSKVIELEADRFQNLAYETPAFQTEALAVLGEYNKNAADPVNKMEEVLAENAFAKHTYKHTTMGFEKDIRAMPKYFDYSKGFFQRFYTPDNATIFVVGDFDKAAALAEIQKHYGSWSGKVEQVKTPAEPKQKAEKKVELPWPAETHPRIMVGYHTPPLAADATDAAIQSLLGPYLFGPTSPLHKDLVLERQLAEELKPMYYDHRDAHLFYFLLVGKRHDAMPELAKATDAAIAELREGKVDARRLADIQSNMRYGLALSLETASSIAMQLAWYAGPTGEPEAVNKLFDAMAKVQPDDLVRFAKAHLGPENRTVVALVKGPEKPKVLPVKADAEKKPKADGVKKAKPAAEGVKPVSGAAAAPAKKVEAKDAAKPGKKDAAKPGKKDAAKPEKKDGPKKDAGKKEGAN